MSAPGTQTVVVRVRLNDHFVFVGEMDAGGEDALEVQINGRSMVGVRGDGSVITWNREGEADTTKPEGWIDG
jgi:hypothetical protein